MFWIKAWLFIAAICSCNFANAVFSHNGRIAIIIDDIGYNKALSERAARLSGAFTLSILPLTPHGASTAELAHKNNKELMLHAPMSNLKNMPLGQGGIYSDMSKDALVSVFRKDINSVPYIKGMNNHEGSRLTQEVSSMNWIMEEMRNRGLYFVDSRTSAQTIAYDTAQRFHIPSVKRDFFLDNIPEISAITQQVYAAISMAKKRGSVIAIGHPNPSTLAVLENIQPILNKNQITLVFVSQLFPVPESTKTSTINTLEFCADQPTCLCNKPAIKVKLEDIVNSVIF